jgi:hypothetical protein
VNPGHAGHCILLSQAHFIVRRGHDPAAGLHPSDAKSLLGRGDRLVVVGTTRGEPPQLHLCPLVRARKLQLTLLHFANIHLWAFDFIHHNCSVHFILSLLPTPGPVPDPLVQSLTPWLTTLPPCQLVPAKKSYPRNPGVATWRRPDESSSAETDPRDHMSKFSPRRSSPSRWRKGGFSRGQSNFENQMLP